MAKRVGFEKNNLDDRNWRLEARPISNHPSFNAHSLIDMLTPALVRCQAVAKSPVSLNMPTPRRSCRLLCVLQCSLAKSLTSQQPHLLNMSVAVSLAGYACPGGTLELKQSYMIFQEPSDCLSYRVKALPDGIALIVSPPAFGVIVNVYVQ